ncbi:3'-5' exonuclease, partial [Alteromonas macleodii]
KTVMANPLPREPSADPDALAQLRQEAIDKQWSFGVTRLRSQYRMKPKPGAQPVSWVSSPYNRTKNPVYLVSDCVPLRPRQQRSAPTQKQCLARKITSLRSKLRATRFQESILLKQLLERAGRNICVLDTETTGLEAHDQIIELAIVDVAGTPLFTQRFKPTVSIHPKASEVHGIQIGALEHSDGWPTHHHTIQDILKNKTVAIFNADFDLAKLKATSAAFSLDTRWVDELDTLCVMQWAVDIFGATNRYGTISLANTVGECGLTFEGDAHSALADSLMTQRALLSMSELATPLELELDTLQRQKDAL